jgi:hypothetical protein
MQCINSGLPSGDIVSDANALLHSSSAARFGGSNDMNTTSYRLIRNIKSKMILKMYVLVGPAPNVNLQYEPYCCIRQY